MPQDRKPSESYVAATQITQSGLNPKILDAVPPSPEVVPSLIPSFAEIIDADHFTIERFAVRLRNPLISASQRQATLHEIAWRLTRHDISEELVMRPAFIKYMGKEGEEIVEHDRKDHTRAKDLLVALLDLDFSSPDQEVSDQSSSVVPRSTKAALRVLTETFDELGEHMKIESGEMIPRLESCLSRAASQDLARRYAQTLVLTPDVAVPIIEEDTNSKQTQSVSLSTEIDTVSMSQRQRCFQGGVHEFVSCPASRFRQIFSSIIQESQDIDPTYLDQKVKSELATLRVGKWKSMRERDMQREEWKIKPVHEQDKDKDKEDRKGKL